jgi:mono/diheme cytochrome c family protein
MCNTGAVRILPRTALVLALALALAGVSALAACGGDDTPEATPEEMPATTEEMPATEEMPTTEAEATTAEETTEETAAAGGDAANGATVFESAGCGTCHTLEAAGSTGTTGPNLDDLQPDEETVVEQVTNGGGGMPAFSGQLSEQEILDVAAYVVESTQG